MFEPSNIQLYNTLLGEAAVIPLTSLGTVWGFKRCSRMRPWIIFRIRQIFSGGEKWTSATKKQQCRTKENVRHTSAGNKDLLSLEQVP